MGTIDLPATIDYITSVTGHHRMHYVGHSQGTTAFFVMCSMRPEYNDRILSGHMLAPIAFMGRLFSPFVRLAALMQNTIDVKFRFLFFFLLVIIRFIRFKFVVWCKSTWNLRVPSKQ